jgi:hypothetical protein
MTVNTSGNTEKQLLFRFKYRKRDSKANSIGRVVNRLCPSEILSTLLSSSKLSSPTVESSSTTSLPTSVIPFFIRTSVFPPSFDRAKAS